MAQDATSGVDRIESAANIALTVSEPGQDSGQNAIENLIESAQEALGLDDGGSDGEAKSITIPISRLDTTKEIEINEIRENTLKASGYSITSISYSGSMMFKGSKYTKDLGSGNQYNLDNILYDDNDAPKPFVITITHNVGGETTSEGYTDVMVTSDSYEVRSEETTETAFDWVAMDEQ